MNKQLIISNMKEIIRAVPNTYAAYVAQTTLNHIENAVAQQNEFEESQRKLVEMVAKGEAYYV